MQLYEKLKNLEKRRYEHKHSIHPTADKSYFPLSSSHLRAKISYFHYSISN